MLAGETVDIIYTDPPWNNMRYWTTLDRKMTGRDRSPEKFSAALDRLFELTHRYLRGYLFVEMGNMWAHEIVDRVAGMSDTHTMTLPYRASTSTLIVAATAGMPPFPKLRPEGAGANLVASLIAGVAVPGGILLDPFCGMGYSARAAVGAGMVFRGNELNYERLTKTAAFLRGETLR